LHTTHQRKRDVKALRGLKSDFVMDRTCLLFGDFTYPPGCVEVLLNGTSMIWISLSFRGRTDCQRLFAEMSTLLR